MVAESTAKVELATAMVLGMVPPAKVNAVASPKRRYLVLRIMSFLRIVLIIKQLYHLSRKNPLPLNFSFTMEVADKWLIFTYITID
jgi:hypothetical protein